MPSSRWPLLNYTSLLAQKISCNPLLIEVEDEFVAGVFRQQIKGHLGEVSLFFGQELTVSTFEEKFLGLNLFSREEQFLVMDAHQMPKASVDFLLETEVDWKQKRAIFMATKKSRPLEKFFSKQGHHHRVELPRFWQMEQLLEFFAGHFQLSFDGEGKRFFMDSVEQTSRQYFELCSRLRGEHSPPRTLGRRDIEGVLRRGRLDQFALARNLGERNFRAFYGALLGEEYTFEDLRQTFSFLQSHMVKLLDPSYLEGKARPSSYDRQVVDQSRRWDKEGPLEMLRELGELELACKKREVGLKNRLRMKYLELGA